MTKNSAALSPTDWDAFQPDANNNWDRQKAAHLFRRSGFGGSYQQILESEKMGFTKTIDRLFKQLNDRSMDREMAKAGRMVTGGPDAGQLAAWWLLRMVKTPSPLVEKMTLFWHGHFATGAEKVLNSRAMFRQNQLLRKHAFGKFVPFVKNISSDVAMLVYLDSEENRKTRPNENYARELLELFCLGPGNYTERDIKEIARCFTGWTIRRGKFEFNQHQHDTKAKSFLGASGSFDGNDAVEVVLKQPAAARFIAKKLIRFFVVDDIAISDDFAAPIAKTLREHDFVIEPALKQILTSRFFYSDQAMARKIKSPVELAIGFLRFFDASTNVDVLGKSLKTLGQLPLYPPNVKGWDGGRNWINASTILARANLIQDVLNHKTTKYQAGNLDAWMQRNGFQGKPTKWIDEMEHVFFAQPLSAETKRSITKLLQPTDSPKQMLATLAAMPEFQLN